MWSKAFWRGAGERAVKTFGQALLTFFALGQADVLSVDWRVALAGAGTAALLSVLTSVASSPLGPEQTVGSATLVDDVSK